jgi:hypothetical protein
MMKLVSPRGPVMVVAGHRVREGWRQFLCLLSATHLIPGGFGSFTPGARSGEVVREKQRPTASAVLHVVQVHLLRPSSGTGAGTFLTARRGARDDRS